MSMTDTSTTVQPTTGVMTFTTKNSVYVATWPREGGYEERHRALLRCIRGTFAGETFEVHSEDLRDLVHVGERPVIDTLEPWGRELRFTEITWKAMN